MDKFFTVDDIAKMTMFTTRTIRNYLKDGLLSGRKIGGQWRFTENDIQNFFEQKHVTNTIKSNKRQDVLDFLDRIFAEYTDEIQTCTVIDVYRPLESITQLRDELMCIVNSEDTVFKRFSYEYNEEEGHARFILFGHPNYIYEMMSVLKGCVQ